MRNPIPLTLSATPGEFTVTEKTGDLCWYIHKAAGLLTLKIQLKDGSSYTIQREAGARAMEPSPIVSFQLASTVASDDVEVVFSDTMEWFQAPTVGVVVPVSPATPELMEWPAGSGVYVPQQSSNGLALSVGGRLVTPGVWSPGVPIDTRAYGMVRITLQPGATFTNETLLAIDAGDITTPPVPVYDALGRLFSKAGVVPFDPLSPVGTVYYFDVRAIAILQLNVGAGAGQAFAVYLAPAWEFPDAPEDEILSAVYTGPLNPGTNIIVAPVTNRKIRVYGHRFDSNAAPDNFKWEGSGGGALSSTYYAKAVGAEDSNRSLFETPVGEGLNFNAAAGVLLAPASVQVRYSLKGA